MKQQLVKFDQFSHFDKQKNIIISFPNVLATRNPQWRRRRHPCKANPVRTAKHLAEWRKSTSDGSLLSDAEEMVLGPYVRVKSFLFAECHISSRRAQQTAAAAAAGDERLSWQVLGFIVPPCGVAAHDDTCLTLNLIRRKCGSGPATEFSLNRMDCGEMYVSHGEEM